jgi:serine acetyltransferase
MKNDSGTTYISPHVVLGSRVHIGVGAQLFGRVEVGDDTIIDSYVTIGYPRVESIRARQVNSNFESVAKLLDDASSSATEIGANSIIRRSSVIYEGVTAGEGFDCAHQVTVREGCSLGCNVDLGPSAYIKSDCQVGDYSRIASELCDRTIVGRYCTVYGRTIHKFYSGISGLKEESPILEDGAVVGREACVIGSVIVGRLSLVGAGSLVTRSVKEKSVVVGNPARFLRPREREEAVELWERVEGLSNLNSAESPDK